MTQYSTQHCLLTSLHSTALQYQAQYSTVTVQYSTGNYNTIPQYTPGSTVCSPHYTVQHYSTQHCLLTHYTVQHYSAQHITVQYCNSNRTALQYPAQYSTVTVQCSTVQYSTISQYIPGSDHNHQIHESQART